MPKVKKSSFDDEIDKAPKNKAGHPIIVGCNYHATWQSHKGMRFVLAEVKGKEANLKTRQSKKDFWTGIETIIFIDTIHNKEKALKLLKEGRK